jgi:hypothetical protein
VESPIQHERPESKLYISPLSATILLSAVLHYAHGVQFIERSVCELVAVWYRREVVVEDFLGLTTYLLRVDAIGLFLLAAVLRRPSFVLHTFCPY